MPIETGVTLHAPVGAPVQGRTRLQMPDGAEIPGVQSVVMRYEPGGLPVCVVELIGVRVVHPQEPG